MTSFPTSGIYASVLQGYFGSLTDTQKQVIWDGFLDYANLSANPTTNTQLSTFLDFVNGAYARASGSLVFSPEEIEKRKIMLDVFHSALDLLRALQDTVAVQSENLVFLNRYQQEYTKKITSTPVYVANPTNVVRPDDESSLYTLGYNGITLDEVSTFLAENNGTEDFSMTANMSKDEDNVSGYHQLYLVFDNNARDGNDTERIRIEEWSGDADGTNMEKYATIYGISLSNIPGIPGTITDTTSVEDSKAIWDYAIRWVLDPNNLTSIETEDGASSGTSRDNGHLDRADDGSFTWVRTDDGVVDISYDAFAINWRYAEPYPSITTDSGGVSTTKNTFNTQQQQKRAELNTLLQQYIENMRAQVSSLQNTTTTMQQNVSTSKEAASQQKEVLSSIIQMLQGLISSIFR